MSAKLDLRSAYGSRRVDDAGAAVRRSGADLASHFSSRGAARRTLRCTARSNSRFTPRPARRFATILLASTSGLAACAGASRPDSPGAPADACVVARAPAAESGPPGPVVVGLSDRVDPAHAPVPRTAAERSVFSQLYEPVMRLTCEGRVEPVLASSWRVERDGRRWTFTLRRDARDWVGAPITATDVAASWLAAPASRIAAVTVLDSLTLRVELTEPVGPSFFTRPGLAVRTSTPAAGWPAGSGRYRPLVDSTTTTSPRALPSLARREDDTHVELRVVAGDPRDALDSGVDLLVATDPAVIDYAASAADFRTIPLAWDRLYLLLTSSPRSARDDADTVPRRPRAAGPPESALAALARDAVPVHARPAGRSLDPAGDEASRSDPCTSTPPAASRTERDTRGPTAPSGSDPRVVYPARDEVARGLAERLIALALDPRRADARWLTDAAPALARAGDRDRARAVGLTPSAFTAALRAGDDAAYVLPMERRAGSTPCDIVTAVTRRAPWSADALRARRAADVRHERWLEPGGAARDHAAPGIVPLIETRRTLIIRRGVGGVAVDGHGTLLLYDLRRADREPRP